MAEIGAVASVIQIAQVGAQLSLTLYNIAQTVKSANQDVKRIAKEIALFAQVLKDLGSALERGQGSQLYRGDAYETSRMIVEECEGVFKEIEEILFKKTAKESISFATGNSIPKAERFLWIFRKSRVQLLRSNLESLKSTISLKLAILTYADKRASSNKRPDDTGEVLSLKSLVLANETATSDLREVTDYAAKEESGLENAWRPGPIATHGIWDILPNSKQLRSSVTGNVLASTKTSERAASSVTPNLNTIPRSTHCNGDRSCSNHSTGAPEFRLSGSVPREINAGPSIEDALGLQGFSRRHGHIWGNLDKLELALKKLDVAFWELERIEKNMKLGWPLVHAEHQSSLLIRLKDGLSHFGLSTEQIRWATNNIYLGQRTEASQTISKSDVDITALQDQGIKFATAKDDRDLLVIKRWLPNYFEDILWSHIKHKTHNMQGISEPEPVHCQPKFSQIGKTFDTRLHASGYPGCDKAFTHIEHHQQHHLHHNPEPYKCAVAECPKSFHHPDLLARHMEQQHNDPESHDYHNGRSLSQMSMVKLDPAHPIIATTVPPLSNTMLESATQASSTMSRYSIADHNTSSGFITQPMSTLNGLSQLAAPSGPHGFAPDLVYGATCDDSRFYSSDSCYSPSLHNPSGVSFPAPIYPFYDPTMHDAASQMTAHIAKQQALMKQHSSAEADTSAFSYSEHRSVSNLSHGDLMSPQTAYVECLDDGFNEQSTGFQSQVPNLNRTMSAIYQDECFNPASDSTTSVPVQPTQRTPTNNRALLSPYQTVIPEYLQATNNSNLSMGQHHAAMEDSSTPKTSLPKDALIEYYESKEGSNTPLSPAIHPTVQIRRCSATQTYGATSDDPPVISSSIRSTLQQPFTFSDSCYSPNPEHSWAQIAGQSHLRSGLTTNPSSESTKLEPGTAPGSSPKLHDYDQSSVTLPPFSHTAPEKSGSSLFRKPSKKGFFLGTIPKNNSPTHNPQAVPEGKPLSENSNLDPSVAAVTASSRLAASVKASNTSATSGKAITSPSAERKRKNAQVGTDENAVLSRHFVAHGPHSQPSPPTLSRQISSTAMRPRKSIRASYSDTAAHSAALEGTDVLSSCFDAPSHRRTLQTSVVNKEVEVNETVEKGRQINPDQVVKDLLRKWTTLLDMPLGPSYGK